MEIDFFVSTEIGYEHSIIVSLHGRQTFKTALVFLQLSNIEMFNRFQFMLNIYKIGMVLNKSLLSFAPNYLQYRCKLILRDINIRHETEWIKNELKQVVILRVFQREAVRWS